ncbi:MAG: tetratricopeptide repeat protein [Planctomycetes bacterium]|nr:tetratricopeptide repeat protein [Planctomycetota bacterium]MCB9890354.1 tetratricopeptide repeat protein [Planctomycetota bacterium]MCB9918172.1 tetratricopeptide repeat protein [Planctomycetota bacterium]
MALVSALPVLLALVTPQYETAAERLRKDCQAALEAGKDDRALALARQAWRLEPGHEKTRELRAAAIVRLGTRLMLSNEFERARDLFREGIATLDTNAMLHLGAGQAAKELHDSLGAIRSFRRATELDPKLTPAFIALGSVLYEQGAFDDAKKALTRALELEPKNVLARTLIQRASDDAKVETPFQTHASRHFELAYHGERRGLDRFQPAILDYLEQRYALMHELLRKQPERPIRVMLYTKTEFQTLNRNADWVQAYYDGKVRIPVDSWQRSKGRVEAAIRHELTHAFLQEVHGSMSAWLHEGFAQRMEGIDQKIALEEIGDRDLVDAKKLRRPFVLERNPRRARLLYAQSILLYLEIEKRLGSRGIAPLFERIVRAEGTMAEKEDAALVSLLGVDLEGLIRILGTGLRTATAGR